MVFWLNQSDFATQATRWVATALSRFLIFDVLPRLSWFFLYALYLSLFYAGQVFMGFQWDVLLLESGFPTCGPCFSTIAIPAVKKKKSQAHGGCGRRKDSLIPRELSGREFPPGIMRAAARSESLHTWRTMSVVFGREEVQQRLIEHDWILQKREMTDSGED